MAARSIASLTVSFGLVSIPVKLYSATEASKTISFNLLHKTCGSRVRQQYFCIKEDVPVPREDMAKGYEFAKDQYVMFTPQELKAMEEVGTHMAEITEFVPLESVDPVYFDKAYYLAPDKGGAKPYALLASALRESKRCALGRWAGARQAVHRDDPPGRRRPRDAAAPLRRRGARDEGARDSRRPR
jgi:DNA end-binding protein Ku